MAGKVLAAVAFIVVSGIACSRSDTPKEESGENAAVSSSSDTIAQQASSAEQNQQKPKAETCKIAVDCQQTFPELPEPQGFSSFYNQVITSTGSPQHRGRDVIAVEGSQFWIHAKFAYGLLDSDLEFEEVDIYLSRGCGETWEKITSTVTTGAGLHPTIDAIEDSGGRVYLDFDSLGVKPLKIGRHRVLAVVKGDNSYAELYIDVIAKDSAIILTDIDGTLTSSEMAAATEVIGIHPESHPGSADMLRAFYHRGYSIFYLTARPEWLMGRTREWLNIRGFPPGSIHTTSYKTGAQGSAAAQFKADELRMLRESTGIVPSYAFGNKPSDVTAFAEAGIPPENSYFYLLEGEAMGGVNHSNYRNLVAMAKEAPSACP